jgi:hypothetical protein
VPANFLTNDLDVIMSDGVFHETVTYKGVSVSGIFDDDDVEVQNGEGVTTIVAQAMFTGLTADFTSIADGDAMVIRSVAYTVRFWKKETDTIEIYLELDD